MLFIKFYFPGLPISTLKSVTFRLLIILFSMDKVNDFSKQTGLSNSRLQIGFYQFKLRLLYSLATITGLRN